MPLIRACVIAFSTYSRIPMPQVDWTEENRRFSICFFPLVGAAVGALMALWLWLSDRLGVGVFLRGAVGAVLPLLVTGGIHMDGFMDTLDATASWQPRERRLEILKDPHAGAFAVMGCAAYLLLAAGALGEMGAGFALPVALCFVLSRAMSALTLILFPLARKEGMLADTVRAADGKAVALSCSIAALAVCALWLAFLSWRALIPMACAAGVTLYYRRFSERYFGGVSGDLAGWFLQVMELATIMAVFAGGMIR